MAIYLHDKYAKQIKTKFVKESIIAGLLSTEYDFTGVKTVKISTPQTVPMGDYTRSGSNRYGNPTEMQDTVQEMTLTQDKAFALTIDKGNNADQNGIKAAGKMLSLQISEQAVPTMDKYVLQTLGYKAGKIVYNATALTKNNVLTTIDTAVSYLDDKEVPDDNRALLVSSGIYQLMKQTGIDLNAEGIVSKAFSKGQVGMYSGMRIIKVPASRLPVGMNFMIVYKNSGCAPVKLNDTKLHQDPPGISGNLLEGRQYYDCFVFAPKADGVYIHLNSAATVVADPTITVATGAIATTTTGATVKYTLDDSDPRYSANALTYTAAVSASGKKVKACAIKDDCYPSAVVEATLT